jgi:ribonucleoside-triphosphate reductase
MFIVKRDGTQVPFDKQKIVNAINSAFLDVDGILYETDTAEDIADEIEVLVMKSSSDITVESIQNCVEDFLMRSERRDVARAYIRYRYKKEVARNYSNEFLGAISEKLQASNVQNQNANVDEHSFGGRMGEATELLTKRYALDFCVSPMAKANHENNEVYIHDLGAYAVGMHNCLSVPFDDLLANGFNTRQTDVRAANSANTAFQLVAVLFQLQSLQQFGGVSATHLDWTMVPYIRKSFFKHYVVAYLKTTPDFLGLDLMGMLFDNYRDEVGIMRNRFEDWVDENKAMFLDKFGLTEESFRLDNKVALDPVFYQSALYDTIVETKQAVEGMYHNLNTLQSRSGNQLPFTSINYGTCTSPEGRLVIKALIDGSLKGTGRLRKTSIFPCGIFQIMSGVNKEPGTPNYDLKRMALQSTATRLYPNYANVDWSGNAGYDVNDPCTYFSTMGCRTANGWDINGLGQRKDGRGNICPVTVIMPTLAMQAVKYYETMPCGDLENDTIEFFMQLLDVKIHEAKDMLLERFEYICSQSASAAKFMYENGTMAGYDGKDIRSALKHGTLALGQLGLAETLQILIGCDHTTEKGMELAKRIEKLFKTRCAEFKEEYKLNFGVYFTPAENLCYTAMKKFQAKYGRIPNVSDRDFFTNSIHVPVWKEMSPFEKIDIESQLTGYSSAGCITYVELDSGIKNNIDALEIIVDYAMDKDIPYFAVNVPNDTCMNCGYTDEINDECPMCGCTEIQRLRRVTGYLTGDYKSAFNLGKQQETQMRVKHR